MPDVSHHQRTQAAQPVKLPQGLDAVAHSVAGAFGSRVSLRALRDEAMRIRSQAEEFRDLRDSVVAERMITLREVFRRRGSNAKAGESEALALTVEAARRKTGLEAHLEQIMGALAIHRQALVEMATGEGKTLTIALAAVSLGWSRRPTHIITANDYLAARDAKNLNKFYEFCGVSVAHVTGGMVSEERQASYKASVVYTTAKEVAADFLRDRLTLGVLADSGRRIIRQLLQRRGSPADRIVQRGLHTAIVDEADHAMIDEAVTPLIISRQVPNDSLIEAARTAHQLVAGLRDRKHYKIDALHKEIELTRTGKDYVIPRIARLPGIWQGQQRGQDLVLQALQAREFFRAGQQYVLSEGKIVIVDESTGRLMPQRTWSDGLHQAIEAKEGIEVSSPSATMARQSFQRFFRLYRHLAGLTGTGREAASEFWHIYNLPMVCIPHHRKCERRELPDRIFATEKMKWDAVARDIVDRHKRRQPILVGTRSVESSEHIAGLLAGHRIHFSILNAKRDAEEAGIVARAGQEGKVTIATNMAGRGTDIVLGKGMSALGGLHVIATERHESRRVDRQLFGRAARQGDPGSAQAFVSLDDELMRRHLPESVRRGIQSLIAANPASASLVGSAAVRFAQRSSERMAYQQRRSVLRNDTKLDESLGFTTEG